MTDFLECGESERHEMSHKKSHGAINDSNRQTMIGRFLSMVPSTSTPITDEESDLEL